MRANLLMLLCATLAALLAAELVLRATGTAPGVTLLEVTRPHGSFVVSENPTLKYVPRPGSGDINAYGVRDLPFAVEKPPGTFRIAVIGDSIGFGYCNDDEALAIEDTFPKVLDDRLSRVGLDVEVLNLSVSGYDTVQEVEFLEEKGLDLDPSLVVVAFCLNDAWVASDEFHTLEKRGWMSAFGANEVLRSLYLNSHLFRLASRRINVLRRKLEAWRGEERTAPDDRVARGFARLRALGERHGFETLVVTFPLFEDLDEYPWLEEHARAAARARESGFHHLDLLPEFRRAAGGDLETLQGRCTREHPDERGHREAALAIERYLRRNGLLPGSGAEATAASR